MVIYYTIYIFDVYKIKAKNLNINLFWQQEKLQFAIVYCYVKYLFGR